LEDVFVRKLPLIAGAAVLALAGAAIAAKPLTHAMDVPLADGSVVHVEYVGDVAPKVTLANSRAAGFGDVFAMPALPSFAGFDQMIAQMNRQTEALMRQAQQMARQPVAGAATPYVAAFGNAPAGVTSTTVVSVNNGSGTCTRTTETVSQGPGKPPKVTTNVSGNCGAAAAPSVPPPSGPVSHT
jgi:hypothetical protein